MTFGIDTFKASQLGQRVGELLQDPRIVDDMIALSQHNIPAVQHLGKKIIGFGLPISNSDKQYIGRWVREVMEARGWTTDGSTTKRVASGNLFSTGAVYYPKGGIA